MDCGRRMETVRSAAQHHGVAALEAERARIRRHVRPALVNDPDDAERRRNPLDQEAVGADDGREHASHRIGQGRDLLEAPGDRFNAGFGQRETVEKRRRQPPGLAVGEIARVGLEDAGRSVAHSPRRGLERPVLLTGRGVGEHARGGAGLPADGAHRGANLRFGLEDLSGGGHGRFLETAPE
jgi:hypothetical protein